MIQEPKGQVKLIIPSLGTKDISETNMRSEEASFEVKETEPSEVAVKLFSVGPSVDSKTTDANIFRAKLKDISTRRRHWFLSPVHLSKGRRDWVPHP